MCYKFDFDKSVGFYLSHNDNWSKMAIGDQRLVTPEIHSLFHFRNRTEIRIRPGVSDTKKSDCYVYGVYMGRY
ncbi:uncharacterized protein LOC143305350 isoform X5 [Osmia lignaria lignaria]|uniref:uncharacterized protein LOC143305350 isoform X5 n=1 Tax=Osmia lignaria lignaria TaxID=1437193 RepID=UPI00402B63B4